MRDYWRPKHKRLDEEAKKNPAHRKSGKTPNARAGRKVMYDRYLSARSDLWWAVTRHLDAIKRNEQYVKKYGPNHGYYTGIDSDWVARSHKKVSELEKEMEERGF